MVYDLAADTIIYTHDARQALRPASTMKLLTAITALDRLGADYLYRTRLAYTGEVRDSTLHGDIYIIGGFDPLLSRDDLRAFAHAVHEAGINTVAGRLIADETMKDTLRYGAGWCWDDDNALLSPLVYHRTSTITPHLRQALADIGVAFCDSIMPVATTKTTLAWRTHTIEQVLLPMMKKSNNLYAESLFYQTAYNVAHPATDKGARKAEVEVLKKATTTTLPLCLSAIHIADGSGLSLYNYLSAEALVALLRYAYREPNVYSYLAPALPVAGHDGTLEKRMRHTAAAGRVKAKTGTLTGISSLAGYAQTTDGRMLAFAIINQGVLRAAPAKALQDQLCIELCQ